MSYKQERLKQIIEFLGLNFGCSYLYKDKIYIFRRHHEGKKYVLVGDGNEYIPVVELPLIEVASIKPYTWTIDDVKIENLKKLNIYGVKPNDLLKYKVIDKEKITKPPFWRNEQIKAWCLSGGVGSGTYSGCDSSYWIGFYDDGKIDYHMTCMEDMCGYEIKEFFNINDIENRYDEELQVKFLKTITWLIDENIVDVGKE